MLIKKDLLAKDMLSKKDMLTKRKLLYLGMCSWVSRWNERNIYILLIVMKVITL